ncbi:MAG TPA: endonuclease/exonuclease/phosphatase family protein [Candidatus Paceibacterota bacterium]|nr:endonuclease/exonuclease/phosphatase family protein [Candidatus Paceibacterota bacterium]
MASISLVSVNIERSNHLDRITSLLEAQAADVVCMQELMEYNIQYFEDILGTQCHFAPETRHPAEGRPGIMGNGIFSRLPVVQYVEHYYHGSRDVMHDFDQTNTETKDATEARVLAFCDVEKDGQTFRIGTTHFTWTAKGMPDDFQRRDMKLLLDILATSGEFVLTGDFNAPRGGEIFSQLASTYKDNIPPRYTTSLDPAYHRAPLEEQAGKMVDGLFTTPSFIASDVELHSGISDHLAITATISRM